ncbi:MAG: thiamine pyrophosphate-binding protein, partial [Acidimicrobiaceae bacterium]|nr:thiamine pyrophosphate-binding protein [Acidimicrobiaceae bacterium]
MMGEMSPRTGAEALALMLSEYGVTHVFQVPAVLRRTMVEIERLTGIKRIRPHGEKPAAYMADGYARASRQPGVCMAQVVGALNLCAGLRDAALAHSPVIALTGGREPSTKFRNVYQEVDDVPAFETVTKWNATIDDPERIPDMVRQAFRVATSGSPGPVHLQFAGSEGQLDAGAIEAAAHTEARYSSVPPHRPVPSDATDVDRAVEMLRTAERPVLVAGGGARWSGAGRLLVELAERLDIPVATSLNGKDSIPGGHRLSVGVVGTYSRASANRIVSQADLVCYVGSETGSMSTHFWQVPPPGRDIIQIDVDPEAIGRNYPASVGICGDAAAVLELMLVRAGEPMSRPEWTAAAREAVGQWRAEHGAELLSEAVPVRPERVCAELTEHTPSDAIVVVDTGHAGMWMGGMFDVADGQDYMRSAGHL